MDLKRWFAWACLALMLVTEVLLFFTIREKDAALASLHDSQVELRAVQAEMAGLKSSDVGLQASEILRLRKQNEILTNRFAGLESSLEAMTQASQSNAQHLATARLAIRLQQQHLLELESENLQIAEAAQASETNTEAIIAQKTCLSNLRRIDDAKQAWASDNNQPETATPKVADLLPYMRGGVFPVCPSGGTYSINRVNEAPTCSFPGHVWKE